jgi:hypothetical protein
MAELAANKLASQNWKGLGGHKPNKPIKFSFFLRQNFSPLNQRVKLSFNAQDIYRYMGHKPYNTLRSPIQSNNGGKPNSRSLREQMRITRARMYMGCNPLSVMEGNSGSICFWFWLLESSGQLKWFCWFFQIFSSVFHFLFLFFYDFWGSFFSNFLFYFKN